MQQFELEILRAIQAPACAVLDVFFVFITNLGEPYLVVAVVGFIFWCMDKEKGRQLSYAFVLSVSLNGILKGIFNLPRPIGEPGIRSLRTETATGSSFPSGHSQSAATLFTFAAVQLKRRWATAIALLLMLLVGLSRLYLGVHYPKDVLAGLLLGILMVFIAGWLYQRVTNKAVLFAVTALVLLAGLCLTAERDYLKMAALSCGAMGGFLVEDHWIRLEIPIKLIHKLLRLLIGLVIMGIFAFFLKSVLPSSYFFIFLRYAILGIAFTVVCPWTFKKLKM